jgi:thiamine-phosphate pyrophosphorylase
LFTDEKRMADPSAAAQRLPRGISGLVFRHDGSPNRSALAHKLARICRARRIPMVVAGDVRLAAQCGCGVHLRGARWSSSLRVRGLITSSAHSMTDVRRAGRAHITLVFLSPIFETVSHPGARTMGQVRWASVARQATVPVAALGGVDGRTVRRIPKKLCYGIGAIGALS